MQISSIPLQVTALHWAVLCNHPEQTIRLLKVLGLMFSSLRSVHTSCDVQAGAITQIGDAEQRTPLHYAVSNGSAKCLKALCEVADSAINLKDLRGRTALHLSIGGEV